MDSFDGWEEVEEQEDVAVRGKRLSWVREKGGDGGIDMLVAVWL